MERIERDGFAVNEERLLWRFLEAREPPEKFALACVSRELTDVDDSGANRDLLTIEAQILCAFEKLAAARTFALIADEHYSAARIGQAMFEVVENASTGGHAAG